MIITILKLISAAGIGIAVYWLTAFIVERAWRWYIYLIYNDDIHKLSKLAIYILGRRRVVIHTLLGLFVAVQYLKAVW